MSGFDPATTSRARIVASLAVSTALETVARAARALARRRDVARLAELDDRMLADIGLTRGDVEAAVAEPWLRDATLVLARRRLERRLTRRAPSGRPLGEPRRARPARADA